MIVKVGDTLRIKGDLYRVVEIDGTLIRTRKLEGKTDLVPKANDYRLGESKLFNLTNLDNRILAYDYENVRHIPLKFGNFEEVTGTKAFLLLKDRNKRIELGYLGMNVKVLDEVMIAPTAFVWGFLKLTNFSIKDDSIFIVKSLSYVNGGSNCQGNIGGKTSYILNKAKHHLTVNIGDFVRADVENTYTFPTFANASD